MIYVIVIFFLPAVVRDPSNVAHTVRNLRLNMKDINSGPPQPTLARKLLNEAVANALPDSFELNKCEVMTFGNYDLQLSGIKFRIIFVNVYKIHVTGSYHAMSRYIFYHFSHVSLV